jgi:hypothetical protein
MQEEEEELSSNEFNLANSIDFICLLIIKSPHFLFGIRLWGASERANERTNEAHKKIRSEEIDEDATINNRWMHGGTKIRT